MANSDQKPAAVEMIGGVQHVDFGNSRFHTNGTAVRMEESNGAAPSHIHFGSAEFLTIAKPSWFRDFGLKLAVKVANAVAAAALTLPWWSQIKAAFLKLIG